MRRKQKQKALPPRRKRMKHTARLASARHWLPTYEGKNVVRGYARLFGVDFLCAAKELELLGVAVDPDYVARLECTRRNSTRTKAAARARRPAANAVDTLPSGWGADHDDTYAYIAGRTSGGIPYGVTWEEFELDEHSEPQSPPALEL